MTSVVVILFFFSFSMFHFVHKHDHKRGAAPCMTLISFESSGDKREAESVCSITCRNCM